MDMCTCYICMCIWIYTYMYMCRRLECFGSPLLTVLCPLTVLARLVGASTLVPQLAPYLCRCVYIHVYIYASYHIYICIVSYIKLVHPIHIPPTSCIITYIYINILHRIIYIYINIYLHHIIYTHIHMYMYIRYDACI